jgi:lipopolysaccharide export system permease protein
MPGPMLKENMRIRTRTLLSEVQPSTLENHPMKLLHRHIFASVALTSLAAVGVLTFIMVLGSLLKDLLGKSLAGQLDLDTFVRLIILTIPTVVIYALPMGILTGVLLVLGRMSSDREITAIRAAGVSVAGISAPIFFFALIGVVASLAVNFHYMPRSKVAYETELAEALRQNPLSFIVPRTFIRDFPGRVIYVSDKRGTELRDFWGWELDDEQRVTRFIHAQSGHLTYDESGNKIVITVEHVQADLRNSKDPENFSGTQYDPSGDRGTLDLSLDKFLGHRVNVKQKWLTLQQLLAEWRRLRAFDPKISSAERAMQRIKVQTVIQEKAAMAFSVLSFALIAIPLGIKVSRKETSANLGLALVLTMTYYLGTVVVGSLENHPNLRPDLLMWLPNITFQALGVWMFRKADRS